MSIPILVIGGINMDILGMPLDAFRYRDSNIGEVRLAAGGVGHNIARQLAKQGAKVELMCAFGSDLFAQALEAACADEGVGTKYALKLQGPSCSYLAIHDETGDMAASLNDMALMAALDAAAIRRLPRRGFQACVLDANLSSEALAAACDHLALPLIADPVSIAKALRLKPLLHRLTALKPNLLEAEALTSEQEPEKAAKALLLMGLKQAYISLGRDGLYYASADDSGWLKPGERIDAPATGAGDAMAAGISLAIAQGLNPREAARMGMQEAEKKLRSNLIQLKKGEPST